MCLCVCFRACVLKDVHSSDVCMVDQHQGKFHVLGPQRKKSTSYAF